MENILNRNFTQYWIPIDEIMRKFKGRSKHKVYSPDKPTKWGLKYYGMVDESRFLTWFKLHQKKTQKESDVTVKLVLEAMDTLPPIDLVGAHHIYTDNYYTCHKIVS